MYLKIYIMYNQLCMNNLKSMYMYNQKIIYVCIILYYNTILFKKRIFRCLFSCIGTEKINATAARIKLKYIGYCWMTGAYVN